MTPSPIQPSTSIDIGEEVVETIARGAKGLPFGVLVVATGEIEDAELLLASPQGGARTSRLLRGPCDLVSATGWTNEERVELRAVVAQGGEVVGGQLVRALSVSVRYGLVSALEAPRAAAAPPPQRSEESERPVAAAAPTPSPIVTPPPAPIVTPPPAVSAPLITPPPVASAPLITPPPAPPPAPAPAPPPRPMVASSPDLSAALPPKILRKTDERDEFPETNDIVTHFHFGRCVVLASDGERLRLQQEKDSRVREVALSMLRIDDPTILEDGRKHWQLSRKN